MQDLMIDKMAAANKRFGISRFSGDTLIPVAHGRSAWFRKNPAQPRVFPRRLIKMTMNAQFFAHGDSLFSLHSA